MKKYFSFAISLAFFSLKLKLKEIAINMREQNKTYEDEIKRLEEENQSLETVRKIQEKDADTEKAAYEALVSDFYLAIR